MTYVIFENPGEVDPLAVTTFGVSVKESENPIGFFGTGLKYALAILLRTGHEVLIQSGEEVLAFGLRPETIRGRPFSLVTMGGRPMGFTSDVGKTWDVWMAYREIYCNCKDEGGQVYVADELTEPRAGVTRVAVRGDQFLRDHGARSSFILPGRPFLELDGVEVYDGESRGIFYRGILVHRFPAAEVSKYTYCVTEHVSLTEDRTAKYPSTFPGTIAAAVLRADDERFVREILLVSNRYYEHHLNFSELTHLRPSPAFFRAVEATVPAKAATVNQSAQNRYRSEKKEELKPVATELSEVERETLTRAVEFCRALDFPVDEYPITVTDALGPNILGMAKHDEIFVSRRAFMQGTKRVAGTLVEEFIHLRYGHGDETRDMQEFLLDRLVSLGEQIRGEPL